MLLSALGVIGALAFVLGLGAVSLWLLKRYSPNVLSARTRVPVEVVQRIAIGPKMGLAVVRVGEKVIAVSTGEGGIRTLFELDEVDRQRVLSTSTIVTPLASSAEATSALAKFLPGAFGRVLSRSLERQAGLLVTQQPQQPPVANYAVTANVARSDREFRAMLGGAMSGATKLAVFVGAIVVMQATAGVLRAQAAPPVVSPVVPIAVSPVVPIVAPTSPQVFIPPTTRGSARLSKTPTPVKTGNGASVTPGGAASKRAMSAMQLDSSKSAAADGKAGVASLAPVAGEDAFMKLMPQMDVKMGDTKDGGLHLNGTVGIVVMMGLLTLLPTLLLMMTGFTRILIVLHFLKQAMGTQSAPPAQLLSALALLLTGFVMAPTLSEMNKSAITPWLDGKITQVEMMKTGVKPMREFMLRQTKQSDIRAFVEMSRLPRPETVDDVPLHVLMSAFVASELRTAFQIGFVIYLPFIIIDAVVASVLMSMGMMMLPPAMISLPFKLLLFVLVDGWSLTIQALVQSFK